ncbi:MAG: Jag N-terminal domain-containing protein, partial [Oscillospiraceae bacterium]|nr:Jag N-terminal domain-containing protein [Oscillospiraceae bacterium]
MQKSMEFTGKNEDAAIAAALEQLGLSREEISVEVLE